METEILQKKKIKQVPKLRFKEFDGEWNNISGKEIFINSRVKGNKELPIYSVTLEREMVPRSSLKRRTENAANTNDNLFVAKNDISYNMMRMWQGAFGLSPEDCMVSPAYVVLHPKPNFSSEFFIRYFNRARSLYFFTAFSYGLTSDRLRLYFKDFARIKFATPPLVEQQKIASFFSAVDKKIQQLTRKKELLEIYKKGVMRQLFSQEIRFKTGNGKDFPKWEEKKLMEVGKIITGSTPPTADASYYAGKRLFVSPADINSSRFINDTKTKITDKGIKKGRLIKKGGVLFVCIGSTIGKVAQAGDECITNQQINSIESNQNHSNDFIYALLTFYGQKIKLLAGVQAVPQINKTDFSNLKYEFPSLVEQQKIADFLAAIDRKTETVQQQITKTQSFKKGLLQQMFV